MTGDVLVLVGASLIAIGSAVQSYQTYRSLLSEIDSAGMNPTEEPRSIVESAKSTKDADILPPLRWLFMLLAKPSQPSTTMALAMGAALLSYELRKRINALYRTLIAWLLILLGTVAVAVGSAFLVVSDIAEG